MFKEEEFREFVESKIIWLGNTKRSFTKKEILDAVCQFDQPIYKTLNKSRSIISEQLKKIFNIKDKPNNISFNFWFLHKFNYKKCGQCKEITEINNFYRDKSNWDLLGNKCKFCNSIRNKNWRKNNPDKVNALTAKRRVAKLNATPKWLTKQDYVEIEDIYYQAIEYQRLLGEEFHVDHIIPLQGENIYGLHVPWNLQILTAKENLEKSNKLILNNC